MPGKAPKVARPARITTGTKTPVVVDYQPSLISRRRATERTDVPEGRVEPLRERDIPDRLRGVSPVAATVAYRLANGNWGRVRLDPKDPAGVVVD